MNSVNELCNFFLLTLLAFLLDSGHTHTHTHCKKILMVQLKKVSNLVALKF